MDLWQLHIFCKVVEEKSFSLAGKSVQLSQPTVSSHVKELENHFGCRLIDRLSRGVLPTQAGKLLYTYAKELLALRNEAESAMADFQGMMKGFLSLGGSTIPGGYILPKKVGAFVGAYPEIHVSLTVGGTDSITDAILSGTLELGVVGAQTKSRQLVQEALIDDEMKLVVPADHAWAGKSSVTLAMLREAAFITREPGSGTLKSIELSLNDNHLGLDDLNVKLQMGNTVSVIQAIKGGAGVSILSTVAIAEEMAADTLRALPVRGLDLKRSFYLTYPKYRSMSPIGRAFIRFLRETYPAKRPDSKSSPE
jgi:DNA-binding transcriptional LysR family regulator